MTADTAKRRITVVNDPIEPVPDTLLAQSIVKMSDSLERLIKSGLNEHAILVLVSAETHISRRDVKLILDCLRDLRRLYCGK